MPPRAPPRDGPMAMRYSTTPCTAPPLVLRARPTTGSSGYSASANPVSSATHHGVSLCISANCPWVASGVVVPPEVLTAHERAHGMGARSVVCGAVVACVLSPAPYGMRGQWAQLSSSFAAKRFFRSRSFFFSPSTSAILLRRSEKSGCAPACRSGSGAFRAGCTASKSPPSRPRATAARCTTRSAA